MLLMGRKKPNPPKRKGQPIHAWVDDALHAAFHALLRRTKRTVKAELELALEDYLRQQGAWPPQTNGAASP